MSKIFQAIGGFFLSVVSLIGGFFGSLLSIGQLFRDLSHYRRLKSM